MSLEQSHFQIEEILFDSGRHDQPFDIGPSVLELNIYEDVEKPYLTGTMLQVDNVAFKTTVGITGSERVAITLKSATGTLITKRFIITAVQKEVSSNERTDVRLLSMIEEHAYLNSILKVSKAFRGEPVNIISNILSSYLEKEISYKIGQAREPSLKVIVPNMNPLAAADWIRDKMATSIGSPFFLYASLRSDALTIANLETMMVDQAWNVERPYTYGQTSHNLTLDADNEIRKLFYVENFKAAKIESTLQLAQAGAISANYNTVDITSGEMYKSTQYSDINISRLLERVGQGLSAQEANGLNFNSDMMIGTTNRGIQPIKRYATRDFTAIAADTYADTNSYSYEKNDRARFGLRMKAAQMRSVLLNNVYSATVPGIPYLIDPDAGVGSNIQLNFAKPTVDRNNVDMIDEERSGKFLTYKTRHQFIKPSRYVVHMNIVKLTRTVDR